MKLTVIKNALAMVSFMAGITMNAQQGMGLKAPMVETMTQLSNYQMTGDPDHDFASIMLIHNRGSLEMLDALADSSGRELPGIAKNIEQRVNEEIKELEKFSAEANGHSPNTEFVMDMKTFLGKAKEDIKRHSFLTGEMSQDFANMMTADHEQAIEILNMEMKYGKNAELKKIAQKMLESNEKELSELQKSGNNTGMGKKEVTDSAGSSRK
jgi:uncharacterized protein (DUF305 family)